MSENLVKNNPEIPPLPDRDTLIKEKIISAAYGDLSLVQKISVLFLIRKNPEYKELYKEFRKTAHSVHKVKLEECPDEITEKAFEAVEDELEKSGKRTSSLLFNKPALAGIIAVILLIAVVITTQFKQQPLNTVKQENKYSPEDVFQLAEQQVKSSLAMISKILNKTTEKLEKDIIPDKVSKPIKQGVEIINQLFPKGVKSNEDS